VDEDAPTISAGSGQVAGIGIGPKGEPGVKRRKFAGHEVFVVSNEYYSKSVHGKRKHAHYKSYVGEDEVGQAIREFGLKNFDKPIILQNEMTGAMVFLKYGRY
jgi:hypothetical protein